MAGLRSRSFGKTTSVCTKIGPSERVSGFEQAQLGLQANFGFVEETDTFTLNNIFLYKFNTFGLQKH